MDDISEDHQDLQIKKEPNVEPYIQGLIDKISVKELYQAEIEIENVLDYLNKKGDQFGELSSASFRHNKDNFSKVNLDASILYEIKRNLYSYERWTKVEELVLEKVKKVDNKDLRNVLITGIYGYNKADYNLSENRLRHKKCREILYRIKKDPEDFFEEALNKQAQRMKGTILGALKSSSKKTRWNKIPLSNNSNERTEEFDEKTEGLNWVGTDSELQRLVKLLIDNNLIESKDYHEVLKRFKAKSQSTKKINWKDNASLLTYLIESLEGKFIKPPNKEKWKATSFKFLIYGDRAKNLKQTAHHYKAYNKSGKPKDFHIIDSIIDCIS